MNKKFSDKWKEEREAKRAAKAEKQGKPAPEQKEMKPGDNLQDAMSGQVRINLEKFKGRHLFIATPAYGGMVGESYLKAMVRVGILFKTHNLNFTLATIANESLITRGRNTLVFPTPWPRAPWPLPPQVYSSPASVTAAVTPAPAETATTVPVSSLRFDAIGRVRVTTSFKFKFWRT